MTHFQIVEQLYALRPGAKWVLVGNTYSGLTWVDQVQTKPTQEEIGC